MGKASAPRKGSMQFWPRVRARREYPRVRSWPTSSENKLLGFSGYKVGMTHIMITDNKKTSPTKGRTLSIPVTIVECPPLKILGARFYREEDSCLHAAAQVMFKADAEIKRKLRLPKKPTSSFDDYKDKLSKYVDLRAIVYTMPKKTNIGKKKPEVFEIAIGGDMEQKFEYIKNNLDKEISISEVFSEGAFIDVKAVTKGKGYQGPVKRFGVSLRAKKSEKTKRGPGSICGGWKAQAHMMYRVAFAGQTGYHTRTEWNKQLLKIVDD